MSESEIDGEAKPLPPQKRRGERKPPVIPILVRAKPGLGFYLRQAYRAFSRQFQARLSRHGITHAQWVMLWFLSQSGVLTPIALARHAGIQKASATAVIEQLKRRRLIIGGQDPKDRRKVNLSLTDAGWELVTELIACAAATNAVAHAQLSAKDVKTLMRLLRSVTDSLEAAGDP